MAIDRDNLLPAGMSGANGKALSACIASIYDTGILYADALKNLESIDKATGDNLRRIGHNLGFSFVSADDTAYRDRLNAFIAAKACNGSIYGIYGAAKNFGFFVDKIDIYDSFGYAAGLLLDGTRQLNGKWKLANRDNVPSYNCYADCYRDYAEFPDFESFANSVRPPAKSLICREIFTVSLADSLPGVSDLILDGSWQLTGARNLDPFVDAQSAQLWQGGQLVAQNFTKKNSSRLANTYDFYFRFFGQFDTIKIIFNNTTIAQKTIDLTSFSFKNQVIQWVFDANGGVINEQPTIFAC